MLVVIMVDCESRQWWIRCFSLRLKNNNEQMNFKTLGRNMLPRFNVHVQFWHAWWHWIVKLWCHENVSYIEIMFDENGCMVGIIFLK